MSHTPADDLNSPERPVKAQSAVEPTVLGGVAVRRKRPVVGVVGGGQLARMCVGPAAELGIELRILATDPAESAAQVAAKVSIGRHDDAQALTRFSEGLDVLTFDHEHVPTDILHALHKRGVAVHPGPNALIHAQDKLVMRRRLTELGYPCPRWWEAREEADIRRALAQCPQGVVVKTPRGGYDGHGVRVIQHPDAIAELRAWWDKHDSLLVEEKVSFTRELAAQVARRPHGDCLAYPVVETVQRNGVCFQVIAPAPKLETAVHQRIADLARALADDLGVEGMLAVELFELPDGRVVIVELAMRPHNSGHWSMDGAVTGQFEQHLRAVLDLPLGDTSLRSDVNVMVNLLGDEGTDVVAGRQRAMQTDPGVKIHLYGKEVRPGRKLGHVTVSGSDLDDALHRAHAAERALIAPAFGHSS
ncbi:5-(carboxyamino)imidazole ribonucleotide synthase [Devriesea agamarum]|uniref:5-(carboxyamino)imidazole ribonucleotide synthase n=1 Tax=Devriesea agamarum TaxID=472569 RepID=UPI000B0ED8BF|nr:5-(carboxyamino)imidazole ribonucleotide synthase [Devriesea agamarum]